GIGIGSPGLGQVAGQGDPRDRGDVQHLVAERQTPDLRMVDGLGAVVVDTDRVPVPPGAELRAAGAETFDEGAQVWITGPAARGQAQVRDRVAGGGLPVRVEAAGALV